MSIHSNAEHGKLRLLLSTNKPLNGRFRMITFMARIHMIMNRMHYIAAAMIKHYPCDLTLIQSISCIGILSFSSRDAGNQDRHYTRNKVFHLSNKSRVSTFSSATETQFPSLNALFLLNIIQRGPILSVFNLKVTERFTALAISR